MLMKISLDQQDRERHLNTFTNSINNFTQNYNSNIKIKETNTPAFVLEVLYHIYFKHNLSTTNCHENIYPFILRFRELLQNIYHK